MKHTMKIIATLALSLVGGQLFAAETAETENQVVPMTRHIAPAYPKSALLDGVVGHVLVEYAVNDDGRAVDVRVVESHPEGVFDRAAKIAIKRSRFEKQAADAQARRFVFDIDQEAKEAMARR